MKKSAFPAALLLLGVVLSGCPVYESDDVGCFNDVDCAAGYVCDGPTGRCVAEPSTPAAAACRRPSDCGTNETCSRFGTCSTGDCHYASVGCVRGYECSPDSGRWECVALGSSGDGGAGGVTSAGASSVSGGEPNASEGGTNATAGAAADG